ncbi:unnamed protein product [Calypogeia fissa]
MWMIKPHSYAGTTIFIFGLSAMISGLVGLTNQSLLLTHFTFEQNAGTQTLMTASSMAALNMGLYYIVAAITEWRVFFWFTVPGRILTTYVFRRLVTTGIAPDAFLGVAMWEGIGAALTAGGLWFDSRKI